MYTNTSAEIRPELQLVVQEALEAEKFFIADQVFTPFGVGTKTGEYRKILKSSGELLASTSSDMTIRAPRTAYKEVDRTYEKASFACQDRGLMEGGRQRAGRSGPFLRRRECFDPLGAGEHPPRSGKARGRQGHERIDLG